MKQPSLYKSGVNVTIILEGSKTSFSFVYLFLFTHFKLLVSSINLTFKKAVAGKIGQFQCLFIWTRCDSTEEFNTIDWICEQ